MQAQQISGTLSRINAALAVSWSNMLMKSLQEQADVAQQISMCIIFAAIILSTYTRANVEKEMKNVAWHLWMTVIVNIAISNTQEKSTSFSQQLTFSTIILLVVEQIHASGIFTYGTHSFVSSAKYLFADALSSEMQFFSLQCNTASLCLLFIVYYGANKLISSKTILDAVVLTVFDSFGNVLLASENFAINKITIALLVSLIKSENSEFIEHISTYSRWEAAQRVLLLANENEMYFATILLFIELFIRNIQIDQTIQETVRDVISLALFEIIFKLSLSYLKHAFVGNSIIAFVFSIFFFAKFTVFLKGH